MPRPSQPPGCGSRHPSRSSPVECWSSMPAGTLWPLNGLSAGMGTAFSLRQIATGSCWSSVDARSAPAWFAFERVRRRVRA